MRMRFGAAGSLVLVALLASLIALGPAAESAGAVKLTFIGDSKAAGIEFSRKAKRLLARGNDVRRDLKVCRRLVAPSCSPTTTSHRAPRWRRSGTTVPASAGCS